MASEMGVLLQRLRDGDRSALDDLMPLVYDELRRMARAFMRRQPHGHTLQPTALIHEAFIKLFEEKHPMLADRAHLLALMSRVMRQVLVDHARAQGAAKRGGEGERVAWDTDIAVGTEREPEAINVLNLHEALEALASDNPRLALVVEMRYFGGMTAEESALALGQSVHTVRHELRYARAWLRRQLS